MKTTTFFLLTLLLVLHVTTQPIQGRKCGAVADSNDIENLETGTVTFMKEKCQGRLCSYDRPLQSSEFSGSNFETAATIMFLQNYVDTTGIDFAVRSTPKNNAIQITLIIGKSAQWVRVHCHYIVSIRDDLRVGYFSVIDSNLLLSSQTSGDLVVKHSLGGRAWPHPDEKTQINPFVNGIRTTDRLITIQPIIQKNTLINNILTIHYKVNHKEEPIESLFISYIIYTIDSVLVVSQISNIPDYTSITINKGVVQKEAFVGMKKFTAMELQSYYQFIIQNFGLQKINDNEESISPRDILPQELHIFGSTYDVTGIQLTKLVQIQMLIRLPNGQQPQKQCISQDQCSEYGNFVQSDGKKVCLICQEKQKMNKVSGQCECKDQFITGENNKCLTAQDLCEKDSFLFDKKCISIQDDFSCPEEDQKYSFEEEKCICKTQNYQLIQINGKKTCTPGCTPPEVFDEEKFQCFCPSDHIYQDNKCFKCEGDSVWNSDKNQCECLLPFVKNEKTGNCVLCPSTSYFDQQTESCQCKDGFEKRGNICRRSRGVLRSSLRTFDIVQP